MSVSVIGRELRGLLELGNGLAGVLHLYVGESQAEARFGVVVVQRDRFLQGLDRAPGIARVDSRETEMGEELLVFRRFLDLGREHARRLGILALLVQLQSRGLRPGQNRHREGDPNPGDAVHDYILPLCPRKETFRSSPRASYPIVGTPR